MSATSAPRTARAVARVELTRAILDAATAQLAEAGPAALSVRAVARDLGMASSAVYRYFPSRDALLTALLVEAYDDLGAAVEAGDATRGRRDYAGRFRGMAHGLRQWARTNPHQYALTYGSPVPGYAAPADTVVPAQRVAKALLDCLRDAQVAGRGPRFPIAVTAAERASIEPVLGFTDPPLEPTYAAHGMAAWAALFGHVSLELFGHMVNGVLDPDVHFSSVVDILTYDLGLS